MSKATNRSGPAGSAARRRPARLDDWWRQDGRALRGDWVVVGRDIRKSLERFAEDTDDVQGEAGATTGLVVTKR